MIRVVGKSKSLEVAMHDYLLEAKEQIKEIETIQKLDDKALENPFVVKSIIDFLGKNKVLLDHIVTIGQGIEYWKQHPEQYAEIRRKTEEEEKKLFPEDK